MTGPNRVLMSATGRETVRKLTDWMLDGVQKGSQRLTRREESEGDALIKQVRELSDGDLACLGAIADTLVDVAGYERFSRDAAHAAARADIWVAP